MEPTVKQAGSTPPGPAAAIPQNQRDVFGLAFLKECVPPNFEIVMSKVLSTLFRIAEYFHERPKEEWSAATMKTRLLGVLLGLAISFALPIYAKQKDVPDPQTTQKIVALCKAISEGQNNHDGAAIAALYTRDAVFVTTEGPIIGRQAIQKWYTDPYQLWHVNVKDHIDKLDGNAPHLIGAAGNELWATGEFSETGQGKNSEPIPIKRYWACIYVREADDWKIRMCAWNFTPDSVILVHKSFAPQPAATPSPTANP